MRSRWLTPVVVAGTVWLAGCADRSSAPPDATETCSCAEAPVVDETLLAFLSKAKSAHHIADLSEKEEPKRAIAALEELLEGPMPKDQLGMRIEAEEVVADTHARLADLYSARKEFDQAAAHIASGLELAEEPSLYRGHLFEVKGLVEERRAEALREDGDEPGAEAARTAAIAAYEQAVEIQEVVIEKALAP